MGKRIYFKNFKLANFIYPKNCLPLWIKNFLYKNNQIEPSEIQTGSSFSLDNTVEKPFIKFDLKGNTFQNGEPTPEVPIPIQNVVGNVELKIQNSDGTQEQNYPLTLGDIELCKIDTAQDYFYEENGKWYIHKETGKVVFDENSTFTKWNAASTTTEYAYRIPITGIMPYTDRTKVIKVLTTKFKAVAQYSTWNIGNISGGTVYPRDVLFIVGADVTASGMNALVRGEPLYYILETPVNTEITSTTLIAQLEAIKNAYSYTDQTNINQTSEELPFILDIQYWKMKGE